VLLLGDDESEAEECPQQLMLEEIPNTTDPCVDDTAQGTCSVLEFFEVQAITRTDIRGGKTLKLEGAITSIPVVILVDSGATHNFLSLKLVRALGLPLQSCPGIRIKLGDGYKVLITQCCNFLVDVGPCSFSITALVLETGDIDLVAGMAWLESLGEVTHNWLEAWMRFL